MHALENDSDDSDENEDREDEDYDESEDETMSSQPLNEENEDAAEAQALRSAEDCKQPSSYRGSKRKAPAMEDLLGAKRQKTPL